MNQIEQSIQEKLNQIEETEHVRILHCIESGSRSWGFASPDSDYDVRFVYVRRAEDYLRLEPFRDVIEFQLDEVYDISGWDIQKLLRLLYKSNPTIFEWAASPTVYRTSPEWHLITEILPEFFNQKALLHHYLSMAHHNDKAYLQNEQVNLKKYFYVLRPVLAANWVLHHNAPIPMLFTELMQAELPAELTDTVNALLEQKKTVSEMGMSTHITEIDAYLSEQMTLLKTAIQSMQTIKNNSWKPLNQIFQKLVL